MNNSIKSTVAQQFGQMAANYSTSAVHAAGEDLPRLVAAAQLTGREQVLDAGSGAGHTALAVAPHAAQVVSVDEPYVWSIAFADEAIVRRNVAIDQAGCVNASKGGCSLRQGE